MAGVHVLCVDPRLQYFWIIALNEMKSTYV